jgi:hypothetical protein
MEKQHIEKLEAQVNEVHASMHSLTADGPVVDLVTIIHKPGFTTIAEYTLLAGILEAMLAHTKVLAGLKQALLSGAAKVELNPQPLPPQESNERRNLD